MTIWAKSWFHNTGASLERIVLCYHRTSALKWNDLPYEWWFNPDRIGQETPRMTFHTHLLHPTASLCLHFFFCVFPVSEREGERVTLYPERVGSPPIPCDGNISIDHSKWRHVKLPRQLQASEAAPCAEDWLQEHQGGAVWAGILQEENKSLYLTASNMKVRFSHTDKALLRSLNMSQKAKCVSRTKSRSAY